MDSMVAIVYIVIIILIYFLPAFIAADKKHASGIQVLNLFLGWTFVGWVIALVWAISDEKMPKKPNK